MLSCASNRSVTKEADRAITEPPGRLSAVLGESSLLRLVLTPATITDTVGALIRCLMTTAVEPIVASRNAYVSRSGAAQAVTVGVVMVARYALMSPAGWVSPPLVDDGIIGLVGVFWRREAAPNGEGMSCRTLGPEVA